MDPKVDLIQDEIAEMIEDVWRKYRAVKAQCNVLLERSDIDCAKEGMKTASEYLSIVANLIELKRRTDVVIYDL